MTDKRKSQTKSSSSFLITLNEVDNFSMLREYLISLAGLRYAIAGKEKAPTTGHEHIHIFIQFERSVRLSINRLYGAHVDKCYGTPQQNKNYIEKEGSTVIWERGTMKVKGWVSIKEAKNLTKSERNELPLQFYKSIKDINLEENNILTVDRVRKKVKVYYISGMSGIGKTRFAHFLIGTEPFNAVKYENGFWMGVSESCKVALYDDWRDTHMRPSEFLNFIDYNKQVMNVKGGYKLNNYTMIIITSILKLDEIYEDVNDESRYQWTRRVREIHLCLYRIGEKRNCINLLFNRIIIYIKKTILRLLINYNK